SGALAFKSGKQPRLGSFRFPGFNSDRKNDPPPKRLSLQEEFMTVTEAAIVAGRVYDHHSKRWWLSYPSPALRSRAERATV
ncbi:hypothetical protein, partial [Paenibacillus lactis]|uniref:hypothetical protein n=1 Tax=Paenibacillus lactis TaxID=228574 RepID=UPI0036A0EFEB